MRIDSSRHIIKIINYKKEAKYKQRTYGFIEVHFLRVKVTFSVELRELSLWLRKSVAMVAYKYERDI